ncbi:MAG: CoA transferase, partial [Gammaproteobacteria bacterium]|nr:CoA transferase [Gammaproteobacteria bacterium]
NGYLRRVEHPDGDRVVIGAPIRMSETPLEPGAVAPELGQHTEEVLLEHGYEWDDITALRDEGVFG